MLLCLVLCVSNRQNWCQYEVYNSFNEVCSSLYKIIVVYVSIVIVEVLKHKFHFLNSSLQPIQVLNSY